MGGRDTGRQHLPSPSSHSCRRGAAPAGPGGTGSRRTQRICWAKRCSKEGFCPPGLSVREDAGGLPSPLPPSFPSKEDHLSLDTYCYDCV